LFLRALVRGTGAVRGLTPCWFAGDVVVLHGHDCVLALRAVRARYKPGVPALPMHERGVASITCARRTRMLARDCKHACAKRNRLLARRERRPGLGWRGKRVWILCAGACKKHTRAAAPVGLTVPSPWCPAKGETRTGCFQLLLEGSPRHARALAHYPLPTPHPYARTRSRTSSFLAQGWQ
jgi:hypothetical protein